MAQGGEFRVNTFTTGSQQTPSLAMNATGDFVASWNSSGQDGNMEGAYAQRYNSAGVAQGGEFRVNAFTTGPQRDSSVAMDATGDFVVAWEGDGLGDTYGVFAQRYGLRVTPDVGVLADNPDPVTAGNSITLSASEVTSEGALGSVSFYRESNSEPRLQVGVEGDTLVGTAVTEVGGFWSVNVSTVGLVDGTYTYLAQATDDAGLTGPPASTTNTVIGAPAPAVSASSFLFATLPQRLTFTFNRDVSGSLGLDDIVVQQLPAGPTVTPSGVSYNASTNTATFTFDSALPDGRYRATLMAAGITNPGGTPLPADHVFEFTFLRGDANGDGLVNLTDFNVLAANFGQSNRDFTQGDFDFSGNVNLSDFNILASRFGASVSPDAFGRQSVDTTDTDDVRELRGLSSHASTIPRAESWPRIPLSSIPDSAQVWRAGRSRSRDSAHRDDAGASELRHGGAGRELAQCGYEDRLRGRRIAAGLLVINRYNARPTSEHRRGKADALERRGCRREDWG